MCANFLGHPVYGFLFIYKHILASDYVIYFQSLGFMFELSNS